MRYLLYILVAGLIYGCWTPALMGVLGVGIITGKTIENQNKKNIPQPKPVIPKPVVVEKPPEKHNVTVVLLEDDDGNVGKLEVTNSAGSQVIDQPNQYTVIESVDKVPNKPQIASDEMMATSFGGLMNAQPIRPVSFLLYFNSGTKEINDESNMKIVAIVEAAKKRNPSEISIIGHADRAGNDQFNVTLSLERAEVIHQLLLLTNIEDTIFTISSHGENDLLVQTEDGVAEAKNRRVEVIVR